MCDTASLNLYPSSIEVAFFFLLMDLLPYKQISVKFVEIKCEKNACSGGSESKLY